MCFGIHLFWDTFALSKIIVCLVLLKSFGQIQIIDWHTKQQYMQTIWYALNIAQKRKEGFLSNFKKAKDKMVSLLKVNFTVLRKTKEPENMSFKMRKQKSCKWRPQEKNEHRSTREKRKKFDCERPFWKYPWMTGF